MARPRKPVELLKLQGTYKPERHSGRIEAEGAIGEPPEYLTDQERKAFNDLSEFVVGNVTGKSDTVALALLSILYTSFIKSHKEYKGDFLIETQRGGKKANPAYKILLPILMKALQEFGMTPASRQKFNVQPEEERDPLAELIAEKQAIRGTG